MFCETSCSRNRLIISTITKTFCSDLYFQISFSTFLCLTSFCKLFMFSFFFFPPRLGAGRWRVASSVERQWLARAETDLHRALRLKDPGGLVEDFWWDWCLRHTCVVFRPGELTPSQPGEMLFHEELQRSRVPPAGSGSVSDSRRALSLFRSCCRWTHHRSPPGVRLYFSRHRQDDIKWSCRV